MVGSPVKPENDRKGKNVDGRDKPGHDDIGIIGRAGEMRASRRLKPADDNCRRNLNKVAAGIRQRLNDTARPPARFCRGFCDRRTALDFFAQ